MHTFLMYFLPKNPPTPPGAQAVRVYSGIPLVPLVFGFSHAATPGSPPPGPQMVRCRHWVWGSPYRDASAPPLQIEPLGMGIPIPRPVQEEIISTEELAPPPRPSDEKSIIFQCFRKNEF